MKLSPVFLLIISMFVFSCAQESDSTAVEENATTNNSTTTNTPATTEQNPSSDFQNNTQQPDQATNPNLVQPTLPGNIRPAQQAVPNPGGNQPLNIQPLNAQQQPGATQTPQPVRSIGDERTAHFICPNACKGSGADAAANCPVCGSAYTHNTESPWHEANQQQQPQAQPVQPQPVQATPGQPQPAQVQPIDNSPLPAGDHNTSHYICPDRCVGSGSLSPGKCPVCQKDYVHNAESEAHKEEMRRRGP